MKHNLPRQRSFVVIVLGLFVLAVLNIAQPSYAEIYELGTSTASFQVHVDSSNPGGQPGDSGTGDHNGVDQPDIPENGQEIHYSADGQSNGATGKLPQTSAVQNSLLTFVGIAMMLMAIVWRRQRHATKEEGYYED